MKLYFYGAAGEVTGSNYLLETTAGTKILVDCGAFQGGKDQELKNAAPFLYDPKSIDAVVITHAHLDHVGRLGKLVNLGFKGPIFATPPTKDLSELIMLDSVSIMSNDEIKFGDQPLYREEDVAKAMSMFKVLDYGVRQQVADGVEIRFFDSGHMLGSASVEVWSEGKKIVFSGDIGNKNAPIIQDPQYTDEADYIVCESTYAGRVHEGTDERLQILKNVIDESVERGGVLVIPAFAMERTQELLYNFNSLLKNHSIESVPIFLDSPLAIKATDVFRKFPQYFDAEATALLNGGGNHFFDVPRLRMTTSVDESKAINKAAPPKIVIAGSGMMTGGRIKYHLREYLGDSRNTLLIIGYQAQGTLGRKLLDGAQRIDLFREEIEVRAKVKAVGAFSAHADHPQLLDWLRAIKTPTAKVFCTHGETTSLNILAEKTKIDLGFDAHPPRFGEYVEL